MSPQGDKFKLGLDGAGIAAALRNAGTLRSMAAFGATPRRLCRSSNPRLHAGQRHSGTSARRVEREWYPAIGAELDPKATNWLELPVRIVNAVGVELFGDG
jgi:hypothetical protein